MRTSIAINHIRQHVYSSVHYMFIESGTHFNLLGVFHIFNPYYLFIFVNSFLFYFLDMDYYCFMKVVIVIDVVIVVVAIFSPSIRSLFEFLLLVFYSSSAHFSFTHLLLLFQLLLICMISK